MSTTNEAAWSRAEFEEQLRARGAGYHIHHPFNARMRDGLLSADQIRGWVANRFYYQVNIPQKDGAILANCPDRESLKHVGIAREIHHVTDDIGVDGL